MPSNKLSGQIALVTGGGTGIGKAIAEAFAGEGAKVYITGRRREVLEKVGKDLPASTPGSIVALQMDVVNEEDVASAVTTIEQADGRLDIVVNNAGINGPAKNADAFITEKITGTDPFKPETPEIWLDQFKLNSIAPFFIIRAFTALLTKGAELRGSGATSIVINISSSASTMKFQPIPNSFAYSVSKAAMDQLTVVLAANFATRGVPIRVNSISPGIFASELSQAQEGAPGGLAELTKNTFPGFPSAIPARRPGTPQEMGDTAVYFATAGYTNGVNIKIDGGFSIVNP